VHVASPPGQAPLPGVRLHTLAVPPLPPAARALTLVAAAWAVMRRRSWDVVQSHERTLGQDVYRAGEGCHRAYLAAVPRPGRRGLYHRVVLALERRVFARTAQVVAISRAGEEEIATLYGVPLARRSVVYNGVDLVRFHPERRAALGPAARAEAGVPREAWAVLFLGSGFERKGLATAVDALAHLDDRQSRLLVVGRGDRRPYVALAERLGVAGRVHWLGPRPDAERWYAAADAVALPSRYEPFGNVHLEALASGVPVVTSVRAGGAEVIGDEASGAVVDPQDGAAVARALMRLRGLDPSGVRAAARRAAEPFTFARQVAGFLAVYRRCAGASPHFP
jgi:UDP-glucose:(heptosyl)LPS alpha-1,3-glucosyltransferase